MSSDGLGISHPLSSPMLPPPEVQNGAASEAAEHAEPQQHNTKQSASENSKELHSTEQSLNRMHSARPSPSNPPMLRWSGYEGTTDNRPSLFVGAYTAVTKRLWEEALQTRGTPCRDAPLPDIAPKPPQITSVEYPFTEDRELYEMYRNPWNRVRVGRLLEDMDSLAGYVAFLHCDDGDGGRLPPLLVTAAVERIAILQPVALERDATLQGEVVYTGTSSMDIRLTLHQAPSPTPSIAALFTFVARDPNTQKATKVNPLVPQTAEQRQRFQERSEIAQALKAARKAAAAWVGQNGAQSCAIVGVNGGAAVQSSLQREWANELLAEARRMSRMPGLADGGAVLMDSTRLSNTFTCQPQSRNMHGRIFGGFLMRRAYELAYATVYMFAGSKPKFVQVDRVEFRNPVDIGDLLTFDSAVMHAQNLPQHSAGPRGRVHVEVQACVVRPERQATFPTNAFQFTFETRLTAAEGSMGATSALVVRQLKRVLPATEAQARRIEQFFDQHMSGDAIQLDKSQ